MAKTKTPAVKPTGKSTKAPTTKVAATRGRKPETSPEITRAGTKLAALIESLKAGAGASLAEIATATGWQHHSIRGAISGQLKRKLRLGVTSTKGTDGVRRYRIAA